MLNMLSVLLGLVMTQQSGTVITADEIAATLKQSIANNVVDAPVKLAEVPGGHKASLAVLRGRKPCPSQTGTHKGGESRRVGPKDVIIVPAGMPHRFSELDGPIVYLVYRFEPKP